ncbi:hypothetical protein BJF92_13800 [Rhizobium rhizosphaerae]|uniref:Uncharacterized protein n=2 Tax=Xaviernesmea rhizosphaerae TaxID=1672749 RepID=A0A1Q9AI51_9HYPH|nr:hypothetical protein BJF92_13800 [Xaviernesmea rhizosphaerae]
MSPDQVGTASKGSAKKPAKADTYDNANIRHLLSAPAAIGKIKGTAKFNFSKDSKLDTVKLDFPRTGDCQAVRKALTAEHGKPEGKDEKTGSSNYVWANTKQGNRIVLSSYPKVWCFAQVSAPGYRPKEDNEKSGSKAVDAIMGDFHANQRSEIKDFCAGQWPTDFVMQKHCIDENNVARNKAQKFDTMKSKDNTVIWAQCSMQWKDKADRTDWVMMSHCLDEQSAALKAIRN